MILLLDTDVVLDVALARQPFVEPAARLLDALERRLAKGFIAWHSLANVYYMVRPAQGGRETQDFLLELCTFVDVAPTTTESLRLAARLDMNDFEDAMQVAAAIACRADCIVTRNLHDYRRSSVPALDPAAVVAKVVGG